MILGIFSSSRYRDVAAFDERAAGYDQGWRGRLTSFDHWSDQQAGLAECHRVLVPGGRLVLVDQISGWLVPTLVFSRSGQARTKRRVNRLLDAAGFGPVAWHRVYAVIINAAVATA
jgi:SAM-dependent methyltransferase